MRYIDWFITTPLLLLDLLLTAGLPWQTIGITILADEVMIVCGPVGALVRSSYKWGFYTFAMAAFFFVVWSLLWEGRRHATAFGGPIKNTYYACGVLTIGIWFLYPIAWGVSEGGNVIHQDSDAVYYGVLDIIAKPVFTAMLLFGHRNIDPVLIGCRIPGPVVAGEAAAVKKEKQRPGDHEHNGATNGATGTNGATTAADRVPAAQTTGTETTAAPAAVA